MVKRQKKSKWKKPAWIEPYLKFTSDPERVEEFMNCDAKNCNVFVNAPRALLCCATTAQVQTIARLYQAGLLK